MDLIPIWGSETFSDKQSFNKVSQTIYLNSSSHRNNINALDLLYRNDKSISPFGKTPIMAYIKEFSNYHL